MKNVNIKEIIKQLNFMSDVMYIPFDLRSIELHYVTACNIAVAAQVEISEVMAFMKKLALVSPLMYDEITYFANNWFTNDIYEKYSPEDYELLYTSGMVFVIPQINAQPIRVIK
jgi:hypothetical protein